MVQNKKNFDWFGYSAVVIAVVFVMLISNPREGETDG